MNEIKKDLGVYIVDQSDNNFNTRIHIYNFMKNNGYNVETCDICNIIETIVDGGIEVLFKFVHYSVRTSETENYYKLKII